MTDDMLKGNEEPVTLLGRRSLMKRRSLMNDIIPKEGTMSKTRQRTMSEPSQKKPRTSEDFQLFCKFILEYENYDASEKEESQDAVSSSGEGSIEKSDNNSLVSPNDEPHNDAGESSSDDNDSFDLVTCFCGKPFAGRPMIECSKCLTWLHLRCAKVKKSDIPDVFICSKCKDTHKK